MGSYRGIVGRDPELAVLSDTITGAVAGRGGMVLVEGPAGIGKTTLLRAACTGGDGRMLTARGLALEGGFPYGIVRQLLEPVRAAAGPASGTGCWRAPPGWRHGCSTEPSPGPSRTMSRMRCSMACTGWSPTWQRAGRW